MKTLEQLQTLSDELSDDAVRARRAVESKLETLIVRSKSGAAPEEIDAARRELVLAIQNLESTATERGIADGRVHERRSR